MSAPRRRTAPQRGDEAELFEQYAKKLVRVVRGTLRVQRDIAEEACAFAWLQLLRTQPERDLIFAWLRVVAIHEAFRLLRAQGRTATLDLSTETEFVVSHPADRRADTDLIVEVRQALEQLHGLTHQQARIFVLHLAGLSYDEIGAATGYSWTQINRHMGRARRNLRQGRGA